MMHDGEMKTRWWRDDEEMEMMERMMGSIISQLQLSTHEAITHQAEEEVYHRPNRQGVVEEEEVRVHPQRPFCLAY